MPANEVSIVVRAKNFFTKVSKGIVSGLRRLSRVGATAGRGLARGLGVGIAAIGAASLALVKLGSDARETGSKFAAVFRGINAEANKTARALARDFGLASATSKQLLGDTGDLLVGFGFTRKSALEMADQVNRLAIDLASFTNYSGGAAGASQALTKLLLGETEQAKSLGIVVRQGSEEYKTAVKETMRLKGVTTLQAKAMVALQMATAQSQNALGDYSRTSNQVANATRYVINQFRELGIKMGTAIIDGLDLGTTLKNLGDRLKKFGESPEFDAFLVKLRESLDLTKRVLQAIAENDGADRTRVLGAVGAVIRAAFADAAKTAGNVLTAVAPKIGRLIGEGAKRALTGGERRAAIARLRERGELDPKAFAQQNGGGLSLGRRWKVEREKRIAAEIADAREVEGAWESANTQTAKALANLRALLDELVPQSTRETSSGGSVAGQRIDPQRRANLQGRLTDALGEYVDLSGKSEAQIAVITRALDSLLKKQQQLNAAKGEEQRINQINAQIAQARARLEQALDPAANKLVQGRDAFQRFLEGRKRLAEVTDEKKVADAREARLLAKQERGTKLSKGDREFLAQRNAFRQAQAKAAQERARIKALEAQRDQRWKNMERDMGVVAKDLKVLLRAPGG